MVANDNAAVLYALLQACGVDYDLEDFGSRLRVQKVVYLMKATGSGLPYDFNWYLRGPYSPDLARDLFAGAADMASTRQMGEHLVLGAKAAEQTTLIRNELEKMPRGISRTHWFEALASAAFLRKRGKTPEQIRVQLEQEKGFGPVLVNTALASVARLGI